MDKYQALQSFWSSFAIPAYDENSVPDDPVFPYITYSVQTDSLGTPVAMSASVWYRTYSWEGISMKAEEIARRIVEQNALPLDNGYLYLTKGTPFENHGVLSVDGADLMDEKGKAYQLKGVSTHGLAWFPQYVNEDAFRTLRDDWGASLVRLAMYTAESGGYCTDGDRQALEKTIDTGVKAATDLGMYVIIDWHVLSDLTPLKYEDQAVDFFGRMSKKYADNGNVLYEICNEPNGGTSWSDIKAYAERVIPVIRANDPDSIIIVGTPTWSQEVDKAAADPISTYDNIMYAMHFYAATHKEDLRNRLISARKSGLPVFISEFSICDASGNGGVDYDSAAAWKKLIVENNLSYAGWSLCNKNETSALLKPEVTKVNGGWTDDDLSETGLWLKKMME